MVAASALSLVSAAMVANSLELGHQQDVGKEKLKGPQEHAHLGLVPDLSHEAQRRERYSMHNLPQNSAKLEAQHEKSQGAGLPMSSANDKRPSSVVFHRSKKKPAGIMNALSNVLTRITRKSPRTPH